MKKFSGLLSDIKQERKELERLVEEMEDLLPPSSSETPDKKTLRAIGSVLHDFYTGIEKIFRRIALEMESTLPEGDDWHRQLLNRMAVDIESTRPSVISDELREDLDEHLRFRHLFRHLYDFELQWKRCRELATSLKNTYRKLQTELDAFEDFLRELNKSVNNG